MSDQSSSHHVRDLQICLDNIKELSKNLGTPHDANEGEKYQKLFDTYKRISNLKHSSIDLKVFQNDEFIVLYRELLTSKNIQKFTAEAFRRHNHVLGNWYNSRWEKNQKRTKETLTSENVQQFT